MARHNQPQGDNQWQNYKGIQESNEIMLSQQLATDVTFTLPVVTGGGKTKSIGAHKYMLISRSPVFWSMFCGDIKESEKVDIKDIEFDVFKEMLNFIYTEKVNLTGDNVMLVLHASKKYIIGSLTEKCTEYLETKLDTSNVCQIFEQCQLFNESELVSKCFEIIQYETDLVMKSNGFKQISKSTLIQILEAKQLSIAEVHVFEACLAWAKYQNQGLSMSTPDMIRKTLGEAIYKIHIPAMSNEELGSVVSPSAILSQEEELLCYRFANSKLAIDLPFPREPRIVANKNIVLSREPGSECQIHLLNMQEFNGQFTNSSACSLEVSGLQLIYSKPFAIGITINQLEQPQYTRPKNPYHQQSCTFLSPPKTLVSRTYREFDDIKQIGGCTVAEIKLDNPFSLDSQKSVTYNITYSSDTMPIKNQTTYQPFAFGNQPGYQNQGNCYSTCFVAGQTCILRNKEIQINASYENKSQMGGFLCASVEQQNIIPLIGIICKCL